MCINYGARRVIDLGSGHGAFCRQLAILGFDVVGCDPSADGARRAQLAAPHLTFVVLGVDDDLSILGEGSFDVVISNGVVEHLAKPRRLPRVAHQLLRPGGRLIVSTPYYGYLKNLSLSLTNRWDAHLAPFRDGDSNSGHAGPCRSSSVRRATSFVASSARVGFRSFGKA